MALTIEHQLVSQEELHSYEQDRIFSMSLCISAHRFEHSKLRGRPRLGLVVMNI